MGNYHPSSFDNDSKHAHGHKRSDGSGNDAHHHARMVEELIVLLEREHRKNVRRPLRGTTAATGVGESEETVRDFEMLQKLMTEVRLLNVFVVARLSVP